MQLHPPSVLEEFFSQTSGKASFVVSPDSNVELPFQDQLLAGAAEADITPPPGMPKAGFSKGARDGNGFRTRVRVRVVHLRYGTASIALVQCDLLSGSSVLQHLVAKAIHEKTDIPLSGLFIGATHTHAVPGQCVGTEFYNQYASNRPGFDPRWTQFLVDQITDAVIQAYDSRTIAKASFGTTEVWGYTRNRSLPPHVLNESVQDKRTEPQRKFVAINPELHLLRVDVRSDEKNSSDDEVWKPLAAALIFSVHANGASLYASDYNADIWAYIVDDLSDRIMEKIGIRPLVGAMEGTHADVAPAVVPTLLGHAESRRVGRGIAKQAMKLYEDLQGSLSSTFKIGAALREIDLDESSTIGDITLPKRAAVGAALVAGAQEHANPILGSTILSRIPPFKAGTPKPGKHNAQGAKWVLGSRWLQAMLLKKDMFPRVIPIQLLQFGDNLVVGLPFEITVETGNRIATQVQDVVPRTISKVVVSSVANEYCGYIASQEEYSLQYYEGGHTLYGPQSQPFIAAHAAKLAKDFYSQTSKLFSDVKERRSWKLRIASYLPKPTGKEYDRKNAGTPFYLDPKPRVDGRWEWHWYDAAPSDLIWHQNIVGLEYQDHAGLRDGLDDTKWMPYKRGSRIVSDESWDLEVNYIGFEKSEDRHKYRVRWHNPDHHGNRFYRFVLVENATQGIFYSPAFN